MTTAARNNDNAPQADPVASMSVGRMYDQPGPALVYMPLIVAGSLAFALAVLGLAPVGGTLPVLVVAGAGAAMLARQAIASGEAALGGLFGGLAGFWLTYTVVVLGLSRDWFGVSPAESTRVITLFVMCWLAVMVLVTVAALELPVVLTGLLVIFDAALTLLLLGTLAGTGGLFVASGLSFLVVTALAAYACLAMAGPYPLRRVLSLGPPLLSRKTPAELESPSAQVQEDQPAGDEEPKPEHEVRAEVAELESSKRPGSLRKAADAEEPEHAAVSSRVELESPGTSVESLVSQSVGTTRANKANWWK